MTGLPLARNRYGATGRFQPAEPGKKIRISRSAEASESLPWIRFSVRSRPKSPRIVPGAAAAGSVAPMRSRTILPDIPGALHHGHQRRPPAHEGDQVLVEPLADVLGVMAGERVGVEGAQLGRGQSQAFALQAAQDLADEAPFDRVGLDDDQGSAHGSKG